MSAAAAITRLPIELDECKTADLAEMFRLLGDGTRLAIVIACLDGPRAVAAIADPPGAPPSLVTHQLPLLPPARPLRAERRGKQVFYAAADDHIRCVLTDMIEHVTESHGDAP